MINISSICEQVSAANRDVGMQIDKGYRYRVTITIRAFVFVSPGKKSVLKNSLVLGRIED